MKIEVTLTNKHAVLIASAIVISGILSAFAFGGSNPAVLGHSALELIVNGSSVVDNSLGAADIDSSSLASECSTITGGAGLCDGSDADTVGLTAIDQSSFNSCGGATTCSTSCGSGTLVGCGCNAGGAITANEITANTCTCNTVAAVTINVRAVCIS